MKHNHSIAWSFVGGCLLLYACCIGSCGAYIDHQQRPRSVRNCDGRIFRQPVYQYDTPVKPRQDREA